MIRLGRRFKEAGEELTAGLDREERGWLLENLEEGLIRLEDSVLVFDGTAGVVSSSSSLGDTSRSSASRLPKLAEFSLLALLSLIGNAFSLSTDGLGLDLTSGSLRSLKSLVAGLALTESLRSLWAGLAR